MAYARDRMASAPKTIQGTNDALEDILEWGAEYAPKDWWRHPSKYRRFYPRNDQARRDAILNHRYHDRRGERE